MNALDEFAVTMTLCFTPEHLGIERHYASPPRNPQDFADFATWAVERYAPAPERVNQDHRTRRSCTRQRASIDVSVGAR